MTNTTGNNKWMTRLLIASLATSLGIIIVLLTALSVMKKRLNTVGDIVDQMAVQHIVTDVDVDQNIPLKTDICVLNDLTVGIDMFIETEIPFTAEIPVTQEMLVPFKIGVKDYIRLDTPQKQVYLTRNQRSFDLRSCSDILPLRGT